MFRKKCSVVGNVCLCRHSRWIGAVDLIFGEVTLVFHNDGSACIVHVVEAPGWLMGACLQRECKAGKDGSEEVLGFLDVDNREGPG